jgi:hypothetical protein
MKRAVWVVLQMVLFLMVFLIGSLLPGAKVLPMFSVGTGPGRVFVLDGLLLMLAVYVLVLLIEAARRRIRGSWITTTLALVLALALGLAMKFGFMSA